MKRSRLLFGIGALLMLLLNVQCKDDLSFVEESLGEKASSNPVDLMRPDGEESAGNNLSFPVIWADGAGTAKLLRGIEEEHTTAGEWWYVWGEDPADPSYPIYSCQPNPANPEVCLSGDAPGDGSSTVYKAYVQKDVNNLWQATNSGLETNFDGYVDRIDWGDNLESVDWTIASQVRTELVLYEDLATPVRQYAMRHVAGWGITEVHGLQCDKATGEPLYGDGNEATVYSHNARLTIQKLNVENLDDLGTLTWVPEEGWSGADVNDPIFNMAVYEAGDGPGYYNAEINVKGKVIYGYTWKLKKMNDGVGYYRITFSFDDGTSGWDLNTKFNESTSIMVAEEETDVSTAADDGDGGDEVNNDTGGGIAYLDIPNNLTYMDVYIGEKQRGAGGGNGGGKTDSPGGGSGGGKDDNLGGGGGGNGPGKTRP